MGNEFPIPERKRILVLGLHGAGKTTMIHRMKLGNVVTTIPTIGFNVCTFLSRSYVLRIVHMNAIEYKVDTVEYKSIDFASWDVGGGDKIRPLWRHYYQDTTAIIWVVDSNDTDRVGDWNYLTDQTSMEELHKVLNEELLKDVIVLIFANKQDLPNALSVEEVQDKLYMTQWEESDANILISLQKHTLLELLPAHIIHIVAHYTPRKICGPRKGKKVGFNHLRQPRMITCHMGPQEYKILQIICDYLPPYGYEPIGTQTKCKIFGCCAKSGVGLSEGLRWLEGMMGMKGTLTNTNCNLM
eukprot:21949_1